jgi:hypothetical protein
MFSEKSILFLTSKVSGYLKKRIKGEKAKNSKDYRHDENQGKCG